MYNGQFMCKSLEEALDFFDELAENNQSWNFLYFAKNSRQSLGSNINTREIYAQGARQFTGQVHQLARKLEALEIKKGS